MLSLARFARRRTDRLSLRDDNGCPVPELTQNYNPTMTIISSQEIAQYRSALAAYPEALVALDAIEDCEGHLEDAAISLGIQAGLQPDRIDWLDGLAKRYRVTICQEEIKADLSNSRLARAVANLIETEVCPVLLATPVLIYVVKTGVNDFCEPLDLKL